MWNQSKSSQHPQHAPASKSYSSRMFSTSISTKIALRRGLEHANHIFTSSDLHKDVNIRLELELILAHITKKTRSDLILSSVSNDPSLTSQQFEQFKRFIDLRFKDHLPLSQLTNQKEFWSLSFKVNEHTLVPRPATETIVAQVIDILNKQTTSDAKILDLGTGSGCIVLSLTHELNKRGKSNDSADMLSASTRRVTGWAVDISKEALDVAQHNCHSLGLNDFVTFKQSRWLEEVNESGFDVIVSNPPYISTHELQNLHPTVKREPHLALTGQHSTTFEENVDGLNAYREIASGISKKMPLGILKEGGHIVLEIGNTQAEAVKKIFTEEIPALKFVSLSKDMEGHDRCLVFQLQG